MSSSIKVCHLTSIHPPFDTRIFVKECSSLAKAGFDVSLIAVNVEEQVVNGVSILNVPPSGTGRLSRMIFTTRAVLKRALEVNAAIYHFHDPELIPVALSLLKKGKKVVYDVHEDIPRQILAKYYIPKLLRNIISFVTEKIENYAAKKFSYIVTATPFIRDRFLKLNANVTEVCNFPVPAELVSSGSAIQKTNTVCYVGSITRARGIVELVKALDGSHARLNLCGTFAPETLREEVASLPGWKNVNELGYASRDQVRQVLSESLAGLVTLHPIINYVDAYPVKMFEYMAAGIPVISSDIPLWKSFIDETGAGICVDPMNPVAIRDAINYLVQHPDKAKEMGERGRQAVVNKYNWHNEEVKLIGIYKKMTT